MKKHIVKKGESLYKISKQYYKVGWLWRIIYLHNKVIIGKNPNLIHPDMELEIL